MTLPSYIEKKRKKTVVRQNTARFTVEHRLEGDKSKIILWKGGRATSYTVDEIDEVIGHLKRFKQFTKRRK